ncbi:MAG TPA: DUF4199 domain-containing protein [Thermoanaerobaculia bacterium]|nr:DUF4199 domain-containing protein [Thermoanaerobaculia bacterium]
MKKIVLTFGLISGAIASVMMFATLPLIDRGIVNFDNGLILGYTSIFLSCLLIFFGIRAYRDNVGRGTVSFGRAFTVGILIAVISCLAYVVSWEIIYYNFMPDHMDKWGAYEVQKMRANGASESEIAAKQGEVAHYKELMKNPLINGAMTFMEPFPVGLVVTLVSAAILRKRRPAGIAVPA